MAYLVLWVLGIIISGLIAQILIIRWEIKKLEKKTGGD